MTFTIGNQGNEASQERNISRKLEILPSTSNKSKNRSKMKELGKKMQPLQEKKDKSTCRIKIQLML